jgi:hypothetical protein
MAPATQDSALVTSGPFITQLQVRARHVVTRLTRRIVQSAVLACAQQSHLLVRRVAARALAPLVSTQGDGVVHVASLNGSRCV